MFQKVSTSKENIAENKLTPACNQLANGSSVLANQNALLSKAMFKRQLLLLLRIQPRILSR